jgi:RNA polymerase sigma-70 factor (ECF subfamily)
VDQESVTTDQHRGLLFSIAYRMIGSVGEAEDLVQETLLRHHRAVDAGEEIENPKAWLSSVVTRLAIDHLRSARVRREEYSGTWLPEPLLSDPGPDVVEIAETDESISMALLVVLESLSPVERAVFILREAFDYGYDEIAEIIEKSEPNTRQIAVRARRQVEAGRPRFEVSREKRNELAGRFFAAVQEGDTDGLVELLASDVTFYGDGGGEVPAAPRPLVGPEKVSRFLMGLARQAVLFGMTMRPAEVNGQPGVIALDPAGRVVSVLTVDIANERIQAARSVVNPGKLAHLGEVADLKAMIRGVTSRVRDA